MFGLGTIQMAGIAVIIAVKDIKSAVEGGAA